ncbi:hypothetical protein Plec18170_001571 [Paecilomyces lecythidis]
MSKAMPAMIPVRVEARGQKSVQEVSVPGKPYKIMADTQKEVGGTDTAPTPVAICLASLSSCTQMIAFVIAQAQGITLGEWNITAEGTVANPAMLAEGEAHSGWETIDLHVSVQTDIPGGSEAQKFKEFVALVEQKCPMTGFFHRGVSTYRSEWVNKSL